LSLDAGERVNQTIYIRSGLYSEQVYIPTLRGDLVIYGETDKLVAALLR
jgi:pectin methylesterase-like acyl-CoA thioesterase